MAWLKWIAIVLAAAAAAVALLDAVGARRWAQATERLRARLDAAVSTGASPAVYRADVELPGLPPPVQRYFRAVLRDGQPRVAAMDVRHAGRFNLAAEGADRWVPFTSVQRSTVQRPGFVWDGRMPMLPGLTVRVIDAYVAGEGVLRPAVWGLVPLADLRGRTAEPGGIAHGEFLRWFAEATWYPTALLPSQGVRWTAVDGDSALATARDGALEATLRFTFDPATGLIATVRAEARGRTVGREVVLTPWEGRWWDYAEREGLRVPMRGEVAWLTPSGRRSYWQGTVEEIAYRFER